MGPRPQSVRKPTAPPSPPFRVIWTAPPDADTLERKFERLSAERRRATDQVSPKTAGRRSRRGWSKGPGAPGRPAQENTGQRRTCRRTPGSDVHSSTPRAFCARGVRASPGRDEAERRRNMAKPAKVQAVAEIKEHFQNSTTAVV